MIALNIVALQGTTEEGGMMSFARKNMGSYARRKKVSKYRIICITTYIDNINPNIHWDQNIFYHHLSLLQNQMTLILYDGGAIVDQKTVTLWDVLSINIMVLTSL